MGGAASNNDGTLDLLKQFGNNSQAEIKEILETYNTHLKEEQRKEDLKEKPKSD